MEVEMSEVIKRKGKMQRTFHIYSNEINKALAEYLVKKHNLPSGNYTNEMFAEINNGAKPSHQVHIKIKLVRNGDVK